MWPRVSAWYHLALVHFMSSTRSSLVVVRQLIIKSYGKYSKWPLANKVYNQIEFRKHHRRPQKKTTTEIFVFIIRIELNSQQTTGREKKNHSAWRKDISWKSRRNDNQFFSFFSFSFLTILFSELLYFCFRFFFPASCQLIHMGDAWCSLCV